MAENVRSKSWIFSTDWWVADVLGAIHLIASDFYKQKIFRMCSGECVWHLTQWQGNCGHMRLEKQSQWHKNVWTFNLWPVLKLSINVRLGITWNSFNNIPHKNVPHNQRHNRSYNRGSEQKWKIVAWWVDRNCCYLFIFPFLFVYQTVKSDSISL